jgi:hypothetical protein
LRAIKKKSLLFINYPVSDIPSAAQNGLRQEAENGRKIKEMNNCSTE